MQKHCCKQLKIDFQQCHLSTGNQNNTSGAYLVPLIKGKQKQSNKLHRILELEQVLCQHINNLEHWNVHLQNALMPPKL